MRNTILAILLFGTAISAQEKITLTTPAVQPSVVDFEITQIQIVRKPDWRIAIYYQNSAGVAFVDEHNGVFHAVNNPRGADVLVKTENKFNHSINSMERRALIHLQNEGLIPAGSVTGTPQ